MRPLPDGGGTERDALALYKRQTGREHPDAIAPIKCPTEVGYLWTWFWELNTGRKVGGMGTMLPVPPTEVLAWSQIRGVAIELWELKVVWALDAAFRKMMAPD
jgi:hypothetical protein